MIKVLIIDDEPKAIELVSSYLAHFSDFQLVNTFRNGLKALEFVNTNSVDVVFLDINMPHLSGLSLSKMLPKEIDVVFTTAYSEHAVESYTIDAIDYLLKPISLERFSKTITKLLDKNTLQTHDNSLNTPSSTLFIRSGLETHILKTTSIQYLKKDGNYMHYITDKKKVMARQTIAEALEKLSEDFVQIQKSFIVNFKKIDTIQTEYVLIDNTKIPLSKQYKQLLIDKIK
ncbi:LytR/AlgR family response regulator transcription factor [Aquimarina litoralis]|uniref:LytR/AlgR family response regulator transcription factor n=1 Tax=Aquimarina litoralis TaxID=584605 RepID=UPI001C59B4B7|nr:response regulator transcription factor [Aquimarina litoralis]MBW1295402.1 response regulator [Aquimarina litoralis]